MIFLSFRPRGTESVPNVLYPETYKHDIRDIGGYRSAQFSFKANFSDANLWMKNGLGQEVVVKNHLGQTIWEGFVNKLTIKTGSATRDIGPLTEISNRVACTYSTPDYAGLAKSVTKTTDFALDYESIRRYGYFSEVLSGGTKDDKGGIAARDKHLVQSASPAIIDTSGESSDSPTAYGIDVDCAGFYRYLERSVYNYTKDYDKQSVGEKLALIFTRTQFAESVRDVTLHDQRLGFVEGWEDKDRSGWDVIQGMVEELGIARGRVGMFSGKRFLFEDVLTDDRYDRDFATGVFSVGGNQIHNSAVLPGMYVGSSAAGENIVYYIESVSYDMQNNRLRTNHAKRNIQAVLRRVYGAY